jgi:hypothetical protein
VATAAARLPSMVRAWASRCSRSCERPGIGRPSFALTWRARANASSSSRPMAESCRRTGR